MLFLEIDIFWLSLFSMIIRLVLTVYHHKKILVQIGKEQPQIRF